jgi:hypothetical protein
MIISDNKLLSKNDKNKIKLIEMAENSECRFVSLNKLFELINKNIFDNILSKRGIIQLMYNHIFKKCNKINVIENKVIKSINNFDIVSFSYKNKLYNFDTIKIKIEDYLKNSCSPHHVKFKKELK